MAGEENREQEDGQFECSEYDFMCEREIDMIKHS